MKKWSLIVAVMAVALAVASYFLRSNGEPAPATEQPPAESFNKQLHSIDEPGSIWWIVNKRRPLPDDYQPETMRSPAMALRWADDAESMQVATPAVEDLERLSQAAIAANLDIMLVSAYRSQTYQEQLYEGYVRSAGQDDADRFSARPGTSEHQTGLAVDLGRTDGKCEIEDCFGDTKEGKWLAANAYKFGFIIRYLPGKENVTGYLYEPWHFRYVGRELASEIHASGQTLEEFFNLEPAPDYGPTSTTD